MFEVSSGSRSGPVSEESTITKLASVVDKLTSKVSSLQSGLKDLNESNQAITDCNNFLSGSSRFKKCNKCCKNNFEYCPSTKYKSRKIRRDC